MTRNYGKQDHPGRRVRCTKTSEQEDLGPYEDRATITGGDPINRAMGNYAKNAKSPYEEEGPVYVGSDA